MTQSSEGFVSGFSVDSGASSLIEWNCVAAFVFLGKLTTYKTSKNRIESQSAFMRCACNEHGSGLNLVYPPSHAHPFHGAETNPQGRKPVLALK